MINNVVLVSGVQQSDSVTHIHVSVLYSVSLSLLSALLVGESHFVGKKKRRILEVNSYISF